jgi:hypothetical protein
LILKKSKLLDLFHTAAADALALKQNDTVHVRAKRAGGLIFLQNNAPLVGEDLKSILFLNAQRASDFNGQHKTSQLVDLSCDSGGFHHHSSLFDLFSSVYYYTATKFACQYQKWKLMAYLLLFCCVLTKHLASEKRLSNDVAVFHTVVGDID